jgi:hypothetical protein
VANIHAAHRITSAKRPLNVVKFQGTGEPEAKHEK